MRYDADGCEIEKGEDAPDGTFTCAWCGDGYDEHEALVMSRLPEAPVVCINCSCGGRPWPM